jgi:hypothetical protein
MIRKDLNSQNMYDAGVALSSLACFISPDLARDLSNDILSLLTSTKPYIRKKAVLILYKVFLRYFFIGYAIFPTKSTLFFLDFKSGKISSESQYY